MPSKIYVVGVGMTKFEKPGSRDNFDYPDMAKEAGTKALQDAGVSYNQIEQAFVGYVYGDSTSGQRAVYELGLTGIPIVNVNNNCSTGSTALYLAKNAIEGGKSHCVLALGFEKMQRGSLSSAFSDRSNPMEKHVEVMSNRYDISAAPMTPQMFGNAGRDYAKKYNLSPNDDVFARIAYKNHKHSVNNPYAQFNKEYSLEEIKSSPMIHEPLTKLQCSPTSDGAAAAVLASEEFVRKHGLESRAVEIVALEMATDLPSSFAQDADCMRMVGFDISKLAAQKAFAKAGIKPQDVQVVELHDCFSANELITYEALGLCEPGKAAEMVRKNDNTYGGKYVVNPSGGLISKGHPLGATGIAQCSELTWQLRGQADKRQVANVKYALQHNIGLGGAAVVGIYRLGFPSAQKGTAPSTPAPSASTNTSSASSSSFKATTSQHKSGVFFDEVEARIKEEGAAFVDKVKATIGFNINCAGNKTFSYVLDLKTKPGSVFVNDGSFKPDVTVTIGDDDLVSIADGKLNMMSAFTQKKVKLSGNMSVAMKLNQVFSSVISKKKSSATTASSTTTSSAPSQSNQPQSTGSSSLTQTTTKHKSGKFFEDVEAKLKTEGAAFVAKVNAVIGFQITSGSDSYSYIIDLKKSPGSVFVNNNNTKPDVTVIISDDDLLSVMAGKLNMMSAFTQKKLKLSGNMSVAMKLNQIFASVIKNQAKL